MKIYKEFTFDAAHFLPAHEGKCNDLHGHTYRLIVCLEGQPKDETGMVVDFAELKNMINDIIIEKFDHKCLNNILQNPTAENLAKEIMQMLMKFDSSRAKFYSITLYETPTSWVKVYREDIGNSEETKRKSLASELEEIWRSRGMSRDRDVVVDDDKKIYNGLAAISNCMDDLIKFVASIVRKKSEK